MPKAIESLLWWILAGTKGGRTRARIIINLKERPMNANQLADLMKLDYKTIRYHLNLLLENDLLVTVGKKRCNALSFATIRIKLRGFPRNLGED